MLSSPLLSSALLCSPVSRAGGGNGGFNLYKYHYPASRSKPAKDDAPMGVVGNVELLNSRWVGGKEGGRQAGRQPATAAFVDHITLH